MPSRQKVPHLEALEVCLPLTGNANFVHSPLSRPFKTLQILCSSSTFPSIFSNNYWFFAWTNLCPGGCKIMTSQLQQSPHSPISIWHSLWFWFCYKSNFPYRTQNWFLWGTNVNSISVHRNRMFYVFYLTTCYNKIYRKTSLNLGLKPL